MSEKKSYLATESTESTEGHGKIYIDKKIHRTTAWMQEVEQCMEQLPRDAKDAKKSTITIKATRQVGLHWC